MSEARAISARQIGRGRLIIVMLAGISALGSMAVHMVVPALPLIADDLTVDAHTAQQVVKDKLSAKFTRLSNCHIL